ncbi:MAG: hypothetical protein V9G08_10150 [Dermatophilaceae bacterium]
MTNSAQQVAESLLQAQTDWIVAGLTGPDLDAFIDHDVAQFFAIAADHPVREFVDVTALRHTARRMVRIAATSRVGADLATVLPQALHGDPAAADYRLGDVIERADVAALVDAFLSMRHATTKALDRLADSPRVGTVASKFVARILADAVAQNREWAEKVPGVSSLFSLGTSAAQRVRSVADRPLDAVFADATDKGTRFAIRRTNAAILDVLANAPVREAALESWDLQADESMRELYDYLRGADVTQIAALVHRLSAHAAASPYAAHAVDVCVTAAFDRYADQDLASVLRHLGVTRRDLVTQVRRHLPQAIHTMAASGDLSRLVRARLEPFYRSAEVFTILGAASAADAPGPTPRRRPRAAPAGPSSPATGLGGATEPAAPSTGTPSVGQSGPRVPPRRRSPRQ